MQKDTITTTSAYITNIEPTINIPMPIRWKELNIKGYRPETREGATFVNITFPKKNGGGEEERAYLFGGLSRDLHGSIASLKYDPYKNGYQWNIVYEGDADRKRYGHSCSIYEKSLVIVAGARMYNKEAKRRECRNDVSLFNLVTEEWTDIKPDGLMLEARRYHCSVVVGKYLLVHGGVNGHNNYLSDLMVLNLGAIQDKFGSEHKNIYRWSAINTRGDKPGPIANHTCQLVVHPERLRTPGQISLTCLPELRSARSRVFFKIFYFCKSSSLKEYIFLEVAMKKVRKISFRY